MSSAGACLLFVGLLFCGSGISALSTESASLARSRLVEALRSPARKLTLSPEIIIAKPTDATAMLLQATEIQKLSTKIRDGKSNAAAISGSIDALRSFASEQESVRGNFPGPIPALYCPTSDGENIVECYADAAEAGASAVVFSVLKGSPISSPSDAGACAEALSKAAAAARDAGIAVVPEVTTAIGSIWQSENVEALVDALAQAMGEDPVAVLMSPEVGPVIFEDDVDEDDENDDLPGMIAAGSSSQEDGDENEDDDEDFGLPAVSRETGRRTVVLGSVALSPGDGRIEGYIACLKERGFAGAILRSTCVPGAINGLNLDLNFVGNFWQAAVGSLKSVRSKSFGFRAKNNMGTKMSTVWENYQKDITESGALGISGVHSSIGSINPDKGDYKGF
mmetsp:Transcript_8497/g.18709  ORF Transcript_8497/g.18709 Transcript_8497/m.18709 type:complete len:395 (-) Transcript_8497:100-1284(-)